MNDYEAQQAERAKSPLGVLGKIATGVHQSLLDAAENGRNGAAPMGCFSPRKPAFASSAGLRATGAQPGAASAPEPASAPAKPAAGWMVPPGNPRRTQKGARPAPPAPARALGA